MVIFRIILLYVGITVISSQRQLNVRNWNNIWTTLNPPTSLKPTSARRLSVLDTIRAAAEASKRLYRGSSSLYSEKVVKSSYPTNALTQSSERGYTHNSNSLKDRASQRTSAQYVEPRPAQPTAETSFSGQRQPSNPWDNRANRQSGTVNDRYGRAQQPNGADSGYDTHANVNQRYVGNQRPQSNNFRSSSQSNQRPRDWGMLKNGRDQKVVRHGAQNLYEEGNMFAGGSAPIRSQIRGNQYEINGPIGRDPIALYAVEGHHQEGNSGRTWSETNTFAATRSPGQMAATKRPRYDNSTPRNRYSEVQKTTQKRYKILSDGSIVDYGHYGRGPQPGPTRASFVTRATKPPQLFSTARSRIQARPTPSAMSLSEAQTNYHQVVVQPSAASVMQPTIPPQPFLTPMVPNFSPTKRPNLPSAKQKYVSPSGGISVVDMYNFTTDFFNAGNGSSTFITNDFNSGTGYYPEFSTSPRARPGSPAPALPTTTTVRTTTTLATTTTTRAPPKDNWLKQGGVPINITYANDNHVCPSSRARWQDFTLYLETKPRLCMIQITFNARYKREPIYHNTWWGNSVEWIYKTIYDADVKFIDNTLGSFSEPLVHLHV